MNTRTALDWSRTKVLVTGASGFLGTHLCRYLVDAGAEVHGLSRQERSGNGIRWWVGDAAYQQTLADIMASASPQVVYHLTTNGGGGPDVERVWPSLHDDFLTTVNVLRACTKSSCRRLVLAASLEEPDTPEKIPATPYAAAKWAGTMYGRMFQSLYGTPVVFARIFMTYGPGQAAHKLVPYVCQSLLNGQVPQLSSGSRQVDWVYIDDVTEGLARAGNVSGLEGQTFDLGSGALVSIRELVQTIAQLIDNGIQPKFGEVAERPMEQIRTANLVPSAKSLAWQPQTSLTQGLERTIAALRGTPS